MHTIGKRSLLNSSAAGLVAAILLAGAVAPASAAAPWTRTAFHHHFYRGVPGQSLHRGTANASELMAVADDPGAEAADDYCSARFKSYDPENGTYLGYDGYEHACP